MSSCIRSLEQVFIACFCEISNLNYTSANDTHLTPNFAFIFIPLYVRIRKRRLRFIQQIGEYLNSSILLFIAF
jgi:hypothetical protein